MTIETWPVLARIAAQLEAERAAQGLKRYMIADGRMSRNTLHALFTGTRDYHLSTLLEAADGLNCDVVIEIKLRPRATNGAQNL